jgi:hypothetical protein
VHVCGTVDPTFRVHQTVERDDALLAHGALDTNLDDAILRRIEAGHLQIDECNRRQRDRKVPGSSSGGRGHLRNLSSVERRTTHLNRGGRRPIARTAVSFTKKRAKAPKPAVRAFPATRMPTGLMVRMLLLGAAAIAGAAWGLVRHYTHALPPLRTNVPAATPESDAGEIPAPEVVVTPE